LELTYGIINLGREMFEGGKEEDKEKEEVDPFRSRGITNSEKMR
jgi:hypothetical protein